MAVTRPLKLQDPAKVAAVIDKYFADCDKRVLRKPVVSKGMVVYVEVPEPYTMAGLAYELDICPDTLTRYRLDATTQAHVDNGVETTRAISRLITRAKDRIHRQTAVNALTGISDPRISTLVMATHWDYKTSPDINGSSGKGITLQIINYALPGNDNVLPSINMVTDSLDQPDQPDQPKQISSDRVVGDVGDVGDVIDGQVGKQLSHKVKHKAKYRRKQVGRQER